MQTKLFTVHELTFKGYSRPLAISSFITVPGLDRWHTSSYGIRW